MAERGVGRHAFSDDGLRWRMSATEVYNRSLADTSAVFDRRERPVMLQGTGETGAQTWLMTVASMSRPVSWHSRTDTAGYVTGISPSVRVPHPPPSCAAVRTGALRGACRPPHTADDCAAVAAAMHGARQLCAPRQPNWLGPAVHDGWAPHCITNFTALPDPAAPHGCSVKGDALYFNADVFSKPANCSAAGPDSYVCLCVCSGVFDAIAPHLQPVLGGEAFWDKDN